MVIHTGFSGWRMASGIMFLSLCNADRHVNLESTIHPNSQGRLDFVREQERVREELHTHTETEEDAGT